MREHPRARWYVAGTGDAARIVRRSDAGAEGAAVVPVGAVPLPGLHNVANALAAFALGDAIGLDAGAMAAALKSYAGLPHRCETVAARRGVRWINDSKGTNVGATVAAIEGLGARGPLVLIAGGLGKGADFSPLLAPAKRHVRCAVLIGRDAPRLDAVFGRGTEVRHAPDLAAAVDAAARTARTGDTVLFSPACASFDMFENFEGAGRCLPAARAREDRAVNAPAGSQALPRATAIDYDAFTYRYDVPLILVAAAVLALGLVMVASASTSIAARVHGDPLAYFWRQSAHAVVAIGAMVLATRIPVRLWERAGPALILAAVVLLGLVLVPGVGREVNGSMRWLGVGAFTVQPSELAKLCAVIWLAGYLVRRAEEVRSTRSGFLKPLAVVGTVSALLLAEPDHGATAVLCATAFGMLFLAGVPVARFALWAGGGGALMVAVALTKPYIVERLTSFLDPWADPYDSGYQLAQALIAVGRGDWFGVGLGEGVQKLFYLPEAHTDFLFAVLAEELGLAGMAATVAPLHLPRAAFARDRPGPRERRDRCSRSTWPVVSACCSGCTCSSTSG